jgi:hypothetical protein
VRALESVADPNGSLRAGSGFTELVLGPNRSCRMVDGLVTGWHEPDASHLLLLEALAGPDLVERAYAAALAARYRWHEFGDSCLLLPRHLPAGSAATLDGWFASEPGSGDRARPHHCRGWDRRWRGDRVGIPLREAGVGVESRLFGLDGSDDIGRS